MYCLKHAQKYAAKANHLSFNVDRLVTVHWGEQDEKQRIKNNRVDFRQLKFALGSLKIDQLGLLVDASDTRQVEVAELLQR